MARLNKDNINTFLDYGIDISTRTLDLSGPVDQEMAKDAIRGLHLLQASRSAEPIEIMLNTDGGDTSQGFAIYDKIREMEGSVTITVYGECSSMGAWILQAADKRVMTKHSYLMIHAGEAELAGTSDVIKNWKEYYDREHTLCEDILLEKIREKHPDFPRQKLQKMLKTDTILTPNQALELGLIDEII